MENIYVTPHQANALKEFGFNEPILKSQALQWFRDKHQLYGSVHTDCTTDPYS